MLINISFIPFDLAIFFASFFNTTKGLPFKFLIISILFNVTPNENPVPRTLETASFAAKLLLKKSTFFLEQSKES